VIRPIAASILLLALAVAPGASARTRPNVPGASMLGPDGPRSTAVAPLGALPGNQVNFVNVPLPAGAEQIDSTYYDLQDMGSLGARIVIDANGIVHVTYQKDFCELGTCPPNPAAPDPYPYRGMAYSYRVNGTWYHPGKVQDPRLNCTQCVPERLGGFGTIALSASGQVAVSQHMNEDGCQRRGDMYLEDSPGGASWSGYLTPLVQTPPDPNYLEFPQVAANPNGSFTMIAESPRAGVYDGVQAFRTSYLAAPGAKFTCPLGWQFGTWTNICPITLFRDSIPGFPTIAGSSNGRVGVAVTSFGGDVYLIESSNGTFAAGTIVTRRLTSYTDASITAGDSTSTQFRPYIHCSIAYNDTTPHVVWSELQARRIAGQVQYFAWRPRIMHWDPIRGVEVVKQVAAGEAERYDEVDRGLSGPLAGQNTLQVDWPQVAFSNTGTETYVAWVRFVDAEVDGTANMGLPGVVTGVGFGDIAASVTRPGEGWAAAQDLTNTPTTDERFFSLARYNGGGKLRIVFQASATNQAGDLILGDRGTTPGVLLRRIAYLAAPLGGSHVAGVFDGPRLSASSVIAAPNPAATGVRFALPAGTPARPGESIDVYAVNGRHVARVDAGRDGAFAWNGRESDGGRAAAGVYFARVAGNPGIRPVQFTLLP
jgi:hypothetical protein